MVKLSDNGDCDGRHLTAECPDDRCLNRKAMSAGVGQQPISLWRKIQHGRSEATLLIHLDQTGECEILAAYTEGYPSAGREKISTSGGTAQLLEDLTVS